jgi:hypothetical protein
MPGRDQPGSNDRAPVLMRVARPYHLDPSFEMAAPGIVALLAPRVTTCREREDPTARVLSW